VALFQTLATGSRILARDLSRVCCQLTTFTVPKRISGLRTGEAELFQKVPLDDTFSSPSEIAASTGRTNREICDLSFPNQEICDH
jgi:hypothetical protein